MTTSSENNDAPLRLALLLCDTPLPSVLSEHGNYHAIFNDFLRASAPTGTTYTLESYDVVGEMQYPLLDEHWDAILLTGSAASAYENVEWINRLVGWISDVAKTKPAIKLFGICFGHQIIARALGGECVPNGGKWEVGVTPINLSHAGHTLFEVDKLNIHQMHRDHVPHVPAPFLPLGNTPIAANQGMILLSSRSSQLADNSATSATGETTTAFAPGDIHILTVQGHPEFTNAIVNKVVDAREGSGVLTAATASDARDRNATLQHDGVDIVGRAMWRILGVLA